MVGREPSASSSSWETSSEGGGAHVLRAKLVGLGRHNRPAFKPLNLNNEEPLELCGTGSSSPSSKPGLLRNFLLGRGDSSGVIERPRFPLASSGRSSGSRLVSSCSCLPPSHRSTFALCRTLCARVEALRRAIRLLTNLPFVVAFLPKRPFESLGWDFTASDLGLRLLREEDGLAGSLLDFTLTGEKMCVREALTGVEVCDFEGGGARLGLAGEDLRGLPRLRLGSSSAIGCLRGRPRFLLGTSKSSFALSDISTTGPWSVFLRFAGRSSLLAPRLGSIGGTLF